MVKFISCALKTIAGGSFAHPKMFIFELGTDNQHPLVRLQDAWAVRPRYMLLREAPSHLQALMEAVQTHHRVPPT